MHIESYLGRNELFMGLEPHTIQRIAREFRKVIVNAGEPIIAEGTRGETYYLIATGEATVLKGSGIGQRESATTGRAGGMRKAPKRGLCG